MLWWLRCTSLQGSLDPSVELNQFRFTASGTGSLDLPDMPNDTRVLNITRGFRLRFNQARNAVENCACAWVDLGISVRDLTLAESIAARAQQAAQQAAQHAKDREPLPFAEIHGLRFAAPERGTAAARESRLLAYEAALFVEASAAR